MLFPHDVAGWLTEAEGQALARLAEGRTVLEIGSYCGRSTICLAQTATHVTSIDPHDGRSLSHLVQTHSTLEANLNRYGVRSHVAIRVGTTRTVAPDLLEHQRFDLIFIDGAHDRESVQTDLEWAVRLLAPGGIIALHDYRVGQENEGQDWGVERAIDDFLAAGATVLECVESLVVTQPPNKPYTRPESKRKVFLGMPMRPGELVHYHAAAGYFGTTTANRSIRLIRGGVSSSVLPSTFDTLWSIALNYFERGEVTHFAMQHDDVVAQEYWLDLLLDELDRLDADLVSAVVPIKDHRGLTSTAIDDSGDVWNPRRLTLAEVHRMPETFTDPLILLNTGLWVCDLSKPWVWRTNGVGDLMCSFHQRNRIRRGPSGWVAEMRSEDWEFSRLVRAAGGTRQFATRKVKLRHGPEWCTNHQVWGTCSTDPYHAPTVESNGHVPEPVGV